MNRLGIIGGNGMLGRDLNLAARVFGYEVRIYDLPEFSITTPEHMQLAVKSSDIIVNCAAYTAVDKAESEPDKCFKVNAEAVGILGEIVKAEGKHLIHISTDFVFGDSSDKPLDENSPVNPLSVYGRSKLEGEKLLSMTRAKHTILRIEWTYGSGGDNFIKKIIGLAQKSDRIKVVNDQYGSPTHTADAARAILCLLSCRAEGLYHFASYGYASRYETALHIFRTLGIRTKVDPCSSEEFKAPAMRPKNSRFDCSKIDKILDFKRPGWGISIDKFLKENKI